MSITLDKVKLKFNQLIHKYCWIYLVWYWYIKSEINKLKERF
jgi:hypothetical protein